MKNKKPTQICGHEGKNDLFKNFEYHNKTRPPVSQTDGDCHLLVSLHNGVGYKNSGNLSSAKPSPVKTLYSLLSIIDGIKLNVDFSLVQVEKCFIL